MLQEPNYPKEISTALWLWESSVEIVLEMIAAWDSVPFIARYRKEKTGGMDENNIRDILELHKKIENLYKAKNTAINGITEMWAMTDELMENILASTSVKAVEEIYKPYKSKKKTKAMLAIEKWFGAIAELIKTNISLSVLGNSAEMQKLLETYSQEEIIEWAQDIIAAEIAANSELRQDLLETLQKYWVILSKIKSDKMLEKLNEKDREQVSKFEIYKDFSTKISYHKPYQILALNRGENIGILTVKIEKSEQTYEGIMLHYARVLGARLPLSDLLEGAFKNGFDTLFKSVENELRSNLSELWEDDAIASFQSNLQSLLMTRPEYGNMILAIDPGFAAGCKMCVLDEGGNPIMFDKIFLRSPEKSAQALEKILKKYQLTTIVVGNGTWVNETIELVQKVLENMKQSGLLDNIYIVNESWASVYSASKVAQEEFPDLDSLDRGTISIGRRFIDPLSELVKVPVGSIWVGMYQHDIPEKKLEEKLGYVVEDTVNEVGINVNTASSYVLHHISWINKTAAKKIYNHRPYRSRADLKKQLSLKVYELAAGFLRVPESTEPLDNTDIHPEQYALAKYISSSQIDSTEQITAFYTNNKEEITSLYPDATPWTLEFILSALKSAWIEKRIHSTHKKASSGVQSYKVWDIVSGIVRNVVAFWAFVDIGMKQDWLVHVSQIADRYVSNPADELELGETVRVKITAIDEKTGKIQLSIKEAL